MRMREIINRIKFPEFTGIKCNMMPFIQGDPLSLPEAYKSYAEIIEANHLEKGEIGLLTIDESFVESGKSQRGYNGKGINRNIHIEVGRRKDVNYWGGGGWGGKPNTILDRNTMVLIANSISNTCRIWDTLENRPTEDGDLSRYIEDYPEETGFLLQNCEVAKISIFTPHECVSQPISLRRQFFRIVGKGVHGREDYFTENPILAPTQQAE